MRALGRRWRRARGRGLSGGMPPKWGESDNTGGHFQKIAGLLVSIAAAGSSDSQPKYGSGRVISRHCGIGRAYLFATRPLTTFATALLLAAFGIAAIVAHPAALPVMQGRMIAARTDPAARDRS